MSETSAVALLPDLERAKVGSCGHILPGMNARLVNSEGKDVRAGESGELWIRGPVSWCGLAVRSSADVLLCRRTSCCAFVRVFLAR